MPVQPQIPRGLLTDPRKLNEWLQSQSPVSISNAGRGQQMTSPGPRLAASGSGHSPRDEVKFTSSATAAANAKILRQQRALQDQFSPRSELHAPIRDARAEAQKEDDEAALMWSTAATATVPEATNAQSLKRSTALISHVRDPAQAKSFTDGSGKIDASLFPVLSSNLDHSKKAAHVDDAHMAHEVSAARRIGRGVLGAGYDDALCENNLVDPLSPSALLSTTRQHQADGEEGGATAVVSPRRAAPANRAHAAFLTPERFKEQPKGPVPPVGHYRPKHLLTEATVSGGYIGPVLRAASPTHHTMEAASSHASLTKASSPDSAAQLKSPRSIAQEKSRNAVPPPPHQSFVFKSLSAKLSPPRGTAAPDEWYWPRCDAKLSPKRGGAGDMTKGSPRRTIYDIDPVSQTIHYKAKPFGDDVMHRTAHMSSSPIRFPTSSKPQHSEGSIMAFDANQAAVLTRKTLPIPNFDSATPHKNPFPAVDTATSVDDIPGISGKDSSVATLRIRGPQLFDRQTNRPNYEKKLQEDKYEPNEELTLPRHKGAVIDPRALGHLPLHVPSFTEFGEAPTLLGVKPNPRIVSMDKGAKREPIGANLQDLTYDTKDPSSSRVRGDPMMGSMTTRDQREKAATVKKARTTDDMYNVPVPPTTKSGSALLFAKQVTTEHCFSHRNAPSHHFERTHERAPPAGTYQPEAGFYHLSTSPKFS